MKIGEGIKKNLAVILLNILIMAKIPRTISPILRYLMFTQYRY